ncbi:MAG: hypothetical protein HYZ50_14180 [Deltaproteobacteria bacterium]|nr:hypothetical protein [Deltaproteobacteria bacterium]
MDYRRYSFLLNKGQVRAVLLALVVWLGLSAGLVPFAFAATFTVDRTDDETTATTCDDATPNDCSLRGAILAANALSEATTVNVPAGTYVLSQSSTCTYKRQGVPNFSTTSEVPLCIAKNNVTIQGASAATTIIDGNQAHRVLFVSADATVHLSSITIAHGLSDGSFGLNPNGGGIENDGTLTLTDSVVSNNSLDPIAGGAGGGGIYNTSVLTLLRSTVSDNVSPANDLGGGILNYQQATLTVGDSTVSNNTIGAHGGGIGNLGGAVTITNSTVSGNTANDFLGGGIANFGGNFTGTLTVVNSTISGNTSGSSGGGIFGNSRTEVHLNNVTITGNVGATDQRGSGGGVTNEGLFTLQNTIIAGNTDTLYPAGSDCTTGTTLISQGHNLLQNTSQCTITGDLTGNILGQDARLGLLLDNGGLTKTHALSDGSPAIDAGNPTAPGVGGFACAAIDQRGFNRLQDGDGDGTGRCDIGAFELAQGSGGFSLSGIRPDTGGNSGSVVALVYGFGVANGATVKLRRTGQPDILGDPVASAGTSILSTNFNLAGKPIGAWDVVVTNPGGTSATLPGGFTIEDTRAPQLWTDVIGFSQVVVGRPAQFTILFGNRGNVDALGVPLVVEVLSGNIAFSLHFPIAPPPPQVGQVPTDWSQEPITAVPGVGRNPNSTVIPLLLPVVPAGFTGALELALTAPPEVLGQTFQLFVGLGPPYFQPDLDTRVLDDFTEGARAYAQRVLGVEVPVELAPELAQYLTSQFHSVVERGRTALVENLGVQRVVYSQAHLLIDLAQFAAARASTSAQLTLPLQLQHSQTRQALAQATGWITPISRLIASFFQISQAEAAGRPGVGCDEMGNCKSPCELGALTRDCDKKPITPVGAKDPNDKVGATGVGTAQFLAGADPLRYSVFFENVESATAPAQEVIVTDQLDSGKVDFDTFSLGPISFGDQTVVPPPGLSQYSTSVDLRPAQALIVGIDARLDKSTGLITWHLTSIDPETLQFPEDPQIGLLPPNKNPPEGDGSVLFTIQPKATGLPICNQASIVFDVNDPILTPEWCNTIDAVPPSSAVQSLSATQATTDFPVQWAGSDTGSGIGSYSLYVSDNEGLFSLWLEDTTELTALFPGATGHTYAFYSVARDLVGNVETVPAQPDTTTRVTGPAVELCGNCLDDDGDGKIDWRDEECVAAALGIKKGVLNSARPRAGDEKIALTGSFAPATIAPPAGGVTLSFIQPGTGVADPDVVLACVQIPPDASGWATARNGKKWTFKDTKGGSLGDPDSKDAVTIKYNAKKQQYEVSVAISEAEVGALAEGEVSTQLSIGSQGWEKTQGWKLKAKGRQLVTP